MSPIVIQTLEELRRVASENHRRAILRFFGEPVNALGVPSAAQKRIAAALYRSAKSWPLAARDRFCQELWESGLLEAGNVAIYFYRRFSKQAAARELRLFETWIDEWVRNWAHCDGVAVWLVGAALRNDPSLAAELPGWTRSANRWKRRAAAVSLIGAAKQGRQTGVILDVAGKLLHDPDEMVQKGVGWLLKVTYPKQPRAVVRFLTGARPRPPRLILRYAAEKMSARDRGKVLG